MWMGVWFIAGQMGDLRQVPFPILIPVSFSLEEVDSLGPMGQIQLGTFFKNKVLLEHVLSVLAFVFLGRVIATKTTWPSKPKIFTIQVFTEEGLL